MFSGSAQPSSYYYPSPTREEPRRTQVRTQVLVRMEVLLWNVLATIVNREKEFELERIKHLTQLLLPF